MPEAAASKVSAESTTEAEKNISMSMSPPDMVSTSSTNCASRRPCVDSGAMWFWIRNVVVCAKAPPAAKAAARVVTMAVVLMVSSL